MIVVTLGRKVMVVEDETGCLVHTWEGHGLHVESLSWSGNLLASVSEDIINFWDIRFKGDMMLNATKGNQFRDARSVSPSLY